MAVATLLVACSQPRSGSPEAVADSFADAYFVHADQEKAKEYTAFGATKMLDDELAEVRSVRVDGYGPSDAELNVTVERLSQSERGKRVRFDYRIRHASSAGAVVKHADVELAQVHDAWKVVRVGLSSESEGADAGESTGSP